MMNTLAFRLSGGQQAIFDFLIFLVIGLAGEGSLFVFHRMATRMYGIEEGFLRTIILFAILISLPYTWWYFEPLVVF
jgi:hypothetical protein